jgi:hypothetical protein
MQSAACFSPANGVNGGGQPWQSNGGSMGNVLSFSAVGNDIYIGLFNGMNSQNFLYSIVIAGWSNTQSCIYTNNNFGGAANCSKSNINVNNQNNYIISFDNTNNEVDLLINGVLVLSWKDPNYQGNNVNYVRFSQYSSNVQICPPQNLSYGPGPGCFFPQNGVISGTTPWQNNGNSFNGALAFQATGNDIYVGLFSQSNLQSFLYAFIISGWGNTETNLYTANNFSTAVAKVNTNLNLSLTNSFVITVNPNVSTINLYINGNLSLSWTDQNYQGNNINWVQYSQYAQNVQICGSAQTTSGWGCYNWTQADVNAGAGVGNATVENQLCNGKDTSSTQFFFAQGNGTCGSCWCCQRST